jgi:sRNA-binding regulator protein Hfq
MLKDVLKLTKLFYNEFLVNGKVPVSAICLYDSYRLLNEVISHIHLVAKHYLALRLDEDFLQHSSLGEPKEKWRHVLNEDLEKISGVILSS